jgi:hypothetical protein
VIDIETALLQQFLNIAQRQRIAKIPPDRTKYETGFGLPPFEDRGSGYHLTILSRHQPATLKVATHPFRLFLAVRPQVAAALHTGSGRAGDLTSAMIRYQQMTEESQRSYEPATLGRYRRRR